jgi:hypothetical protein
LKGTCFFGDIRTASTTKDDSITAGTLVTVVAIHSPRRKQAVFSSDNIEIIVLDETEARLNQRVNLTGLA